MQGIKGYLCGNFLGQFKDQHESPPPSDEDLDDSDRELYMPKDYKFALQRPKKGTFNLNAMAALSRGDWSQFRSTVSVESIGPEGATRKQFEGIRAVKKEISSAMLAKLPTYRSIHTLEIINCKLKEEPPFREMHNLVALRLSENELSSIQKPPNSNAPKDEKHEKQHKLERFVADNNRIEIVEPGALMGALVGNLQVLNLAYNQLAFLPDDFASGARKLRFLDLSNNRLFALPDSILECLRLQILIVDHNVLDKLPRDIEQLTELRKLFASYNNLTALPDKIGQCQRLEKLRLVHNHISHLPVSILNIWKAKGGRLEELLVEGNPLIQPSLTAFEMGGLDRAMRLFNEWVREEKRRKLAAEDSLKAPSQDEKQKPPTTGTGEAVTAEPMLALKAAPEAGAVQATGHHERGSLMGEDRDSMMSSMVRGTIVDRGSMFGGDHGRGSMFGIRGSTAEVSGDGNQEEEEGISHEVHERKKNWDVSDPFYANYVKDDPAKISSIRTAESSMLVLKRTLFVQSQIQLAMTLIKEQPDLELPEHLQDVLGRDFDVTKFTGKVHITDLDLYFNLLVFVTKPMFSSVFILWDKFEMGDKGYMEKSEWENLCNRVPVKLPAKVVQSMYELLAWRDPSRILFFDYVAAWHIHDTEAPDPLLRRIASTLQLEFYGISSDEMRRRLRAKGADDADTSAVGKPIDLPQGEGERRLQTPRMYEMLRAKQESRDAVSKNKVHNDTDFLLQIQNFAALEDSKQEKPTSIGNIQVSHGARDEGSEDEDTLAASQVSLDSYRLSRSTVSSVDSFDAQAAFVEIEEWAARAASGVTEQTTATDDHEGHHFEVTNDRDLARLMSMSPHEILWMQERAADALSSEEAKARRTKLRLQAGRKKKKETKRTAKTKKPIRDHRFKTDVLSVRQAIREAFRNMPFVDFTRLVNYFARKLKLLRAPLDEEGAVLYWHCDDPVFKHATGETEMNPYAKSLLLQMGFVCLNDMFWIWPARHMADVQHEKSIWLTQFIPSRCPGNDRRRLVDMIALFRLCQQTIIREGNDFTGHMRY